MLVAAAARSQDQRPLPRGAPEDFVFASLRVNAVVHEDLDADHLRALGRPNVVLWLHTRSNTLRASTVEDVARFDDAWVELRPPLKPVDAEVFARLPRAGVWLDARHLDAGLQKRVPGARRLAVEVHGPLDDELAQRIARARPAFVRWQPGAPPDVLAWAQFRALPGRKVFVPAADQLLPVKCGDRSADEPAVEVHVASLLALSSDAYPCGHGTRVVLRPDTDRWLVQSVLVRDASAELVLELGADEAAASKARVLLDELGLGPYR